MATDVSKESELTPTRRVPRVLDASNNSCSCHAFPLPPSLPPTSTLWSRAPLSSCSQWGTIAWTHWKCARGHTAGRWRSWNSRSAWQSLAPSSAFIYLWLYHQNKPVQPTASHARWIYLDSITTREREVLWQWHIADIQKAFVEWTHMASLFPDFISFTVPQRR